ncbi:MAG: hydrogenase maturation protease [Spirochaetota bacterium]
MQFAVVGTGNILLGDEGAGVVAARRLQQVVCSEEVEVVDAGVAFMDVAPLLNGFDRVIVVDAVRGGGEPGKVYRFTLEDIANNETAAISLHDIGIFQAFSMEKLQGRGPREVVFYGIEPGDIRLSLELSGQVLEKIDTVVHMIIDELKTSGAALCQKANYKEAN